MEARVTEEGDERATEEGETRITEGALLVDLQTLANAFAPVLNSHRGSPQVSMTNEMLVTANDGTAMSITWTVTGRLSSGKGMMAESEMGYRAEPVLAAALRWWSEHFHPHTCGNDSSHPLLVSNDAGDAIVCEACPWQQRGAVVDRLLTAYAARPTDAD